MSNDNSGEGCAREMPRYKCHKEVWALKIAKIEPLPNPISPLVNSASASYGAIITPDDPDYAPFRVDADYVMKHKPKVGGYYVVYVDGYRSFSPADAFEGGYTRL